MLPGGTVEYFDIARLKALPNVETTTKGWEFFGPHSFMWLNNRHPVLADVRVRRAIMYALDREAMRNVAWYGFGKVATGPFNSSVRYYTDQVTRYPRDVARAKQLLAKPATRVRRCACCRCPTARPGSATPRSRARTWPRLASSWR